MNTIGKNLDPQYKLNAGHVMLIWISLMAQVFAYDQPRVTVPKTFEPVVIDGRLDEAAWTHAAEIDSMYEWNLGDSVAPDVKTIGLLCYDDENLYIACICYDDMTTVKAWKTPQTPLLDGDYLMIEIGTYTMESYYLMINPYGLQDDRYFTRFSPLGSEGFVEDLDMIWYTAGCMNDSCWIVEMQIPFRSLRFTVENVLCWRFDIHRRRPRDRGYWYCWSPHPAREYGGYGYLGLLRINERISVNKKLELLPYVTAGLETRIDSNAIYSGRAGVSGKYIFSFEHVLDFTVLPDFSQIEADEPQIEINAPFALYYNEKRPFFTERKSFFETPVEVFYSRTINEPLCAAKYTGGIRKLNIGFISAYDQKTPWILPFAEMSRSIQSKEQSVSNILRIKKEFSEKYNLGLISTNRDLITGGNSHVFGFDGAAYIVKNLTLVGQGVISWTKEPNDTSIFAGSPSFDFGTHTSGFDGETFFGSAYYLRLMHNSEFLSLDGSYQGYSPEFRADNGFMLRNNYECRTLNAYLKLRVNRLFIEALMPTAGLKQELLFFGRQMLLERYAGLSTQLYHQINLGGRYSLRDQEYQDQSFKDIWRCSFSASTSPVEFFSCGAYAYYGREINYFAYPPDLGYVFYSSCWLEIPAGKLDLKFSANRYLLWIQKMGDYTYDATTFMVEPSWAFTKYFRFRILAQYSSFENEIFFSPLIAFEPTAFTLFYLGTNHLLNKPEVDAGWSDYELNKSKFFIKAQYQFRR